MYEITNLIEDDFAGTEEYVTVEFTHNQKQYSITLKKGDLEVINEWVFEEESSFPTDLPDGLIESIRNDVKMRIH